MRRPLCMMCLAFVIIVFGLLQFLGKPPGPPEDLDGQYLRLAGRVCRKEVKNDNSVIILDQISWERDSRISDYSYLKSLQNSKIICSINEDFPEMGRRVLVEGKASLFEKATNPGEFDAAEYYQIMGIAFQVENASILGRSRDYDRHKEFLYRFREGLWGILDECLPEREAGILGAMLLGRKETLDGGLKDLYRQSGISHILAISGLHITLLGMGFYRGIRRLSLPVWLSAALSVLFMCEYGQMTGFGTSTLRAVLMFSLSLLGRLLGRTYDMITAAVLSCVLLLCAQPLYLYYSGFLLSFGAVMGIALVSQPLQELNPWDRKLHPRMYGAVSALLSGLGIQLATLPVLLSTFYEYPVYSVFLNLIVVPLMGILFLDGLMGLAAGAVSAAAGAVCLQPARLILLLYEKLAGITGQLPGSRLITGHPRPWQTAVYYLLLAIGMYLVMEGTFLWSKGKKNASRYPDAGTRNRGLSRYRGLIPVVLGIFLLCSGSGRSLTVAMLDIGQGDACVIRMEDGRAVMIDGGSSSRKNIGKYQILPYLKYYGIDSLDFIFLSHMDADHISGIREIMETAGQEGITLKKLVVAKYAVRDEALEEMLSLAAEQKIAVLGMDAGDRIDVGGVGFTCLYPGGSSLDGDRNNASLVLKMQTGEWKGIFMGDLGSVMEPEVIAALGQEEEFDLLKVGHHGSNTSTCARFLDAVNPAAALISCGKKNSYGHPGKETLERLENAGSRVFITSRDGALELKIRGDGKMELHMGK